MTRFAFPLQAVLDRRAAVEAQRKRAFLVVNAQLREAEQRLAQLYDAFARSARTRTVASTAELACFEDAARAQQTAAALLHRAVEEARLALSAASKERRAVEVLKERRLAEYRRAVYAREEREIEECNRLAQERLRQKR